LGIFPPLFLKGLSVGAAARRAHYRELFKAARAYGREQRKALQQIHWR
jgi:hypothetical protein